MKKHQILWKNTRSGTTGSDGKHTVYENATHILDPVAMVVPSKNHHAIGSACSLSIGRRS